MLSEGYLYRIAYLCEDLSPELYSKSSAEEMVYEMRSINYSSMDEAQGKSLLQRCRSAGKCISSVCSRGSKHSRRQKDNLLQPTQQPVPAGQPSPAMHVCEGLARKDTYLVPSSCKSICKNYNDLHIAGDYVVPISSVTTDFTCDSGIGPFLESSEIPPPMESVRVPPSSDSSRKPAQGYSSCWRLASLVPHQQPLSDSALNDYLEQKLLELYKQYIMDSTANRASPTQILASELIMTNVDQISMQISRERNMETTKAKDIVISRFLQIASERISSEMSTPSLHISPCSHTNA
ncbi:TLR adapter interacting with SLC15A4 on the lysosome [Rissa tridactyla]|uniref:TLR adapter interacting with SLC15A4 on the lysosome n=1 Tax=Rissa tridactyla TaxID=75485 RepID=UPI0023BB0BF3|nr:TLR adapter interacting with SLC15A4 on the lysosome [Rissa tridactyla]XP_054045012.1 TLR adapter interacting with SLC15A4 on the lysosome [Rissa tridactyla]